MPKKKKFSGGPAEPNPQSMQYTPSPTNFQKFQQNVRFGNFLHKGDSPPPPDDAPLHERVAHHLDKIEKHTGKLHTFLRRGHFFSHRDLNVWLSEFEKGNKVYLYTGRAPSGPVHIGHLIPWIMTKHLQDAFNAPLLANGKQNIG